MKTDIIEAWIKVDLNRIRELKENFEHCMENTEDQAHKGTYENVLRLLDKMLENSKPESHKFNKLSIADLLALRTYIQSRSDNFTNLANRNEDIGSKQIAERFKIEAENEQNFLYFVEIELFKSLKPLYTFAEENNPLKK